MKTNKQEIEYDNKYKPIKKLEGICLQIILINFHIDTYTYILTFRLASQGKTDEEAPVHVPTPTPAPPVSAVSPNKPAPTSARLQLRLPDGRSVTQAFGAREQLSAVRLFLRLNEMKDTPFNLMTTFPKRVFTEDDYEKPLDILGCNKKYDVLHSCEYYN